MLRALGVCVLFVVVSIPIGCGRGEGLLITKGQIVKSGEPLIPADGQTLQVGFIPISPDGSPAKNWYVAEVDPKTGTFSSTGPFKKGLPPGKYRVAVELLQKKKDLFKEKFNGANGPFVVDVDTTLKPIVLDVETATASTN